MLNNKFSTYCATFFFGFILLVASYVYKDYGISWDEKVERIDGAVALSYVAERFSIEVPGLSQMLKEQDYSGSLDLHAYKDRYYPVGFNYPMELAIRYMGVVDEKQAYLLRHMVTFFVAFLGMVALYALVVNRFGDWKIGLIGVTFYLISPRFFAESFFNSKDIVLWAFFTIATWSLIRFLLKPSWLNIFLHGIATAMALNIRLLAVVIVLITFFVLAIEVVKRKVLPLDFLKYIISYLIIIFLATLLMWPLLWENPLLSFIEAFRFMSKYAFQQNTLYFGETISSTALPWHYLPVWILITTPLLLLVFWIGGSISTIKTLFRCRFRFWLDKFEMQDLIFLALFVGPILGVIAFHSVIYDGWRHLYFIYTGFLLTSIKGMLIAFNFCKKRGLLKKIFLIFCFCYLANLIFWMIHAHPYQNTYFNIIIGKNWTKKFDVDYWGLSNLSAIKKILSLDQREIIYIKDGAYNFIPLSLNLLEKAERGRVAFTHDLNQANYIVTNYRLNQTDYSTLNNCWHHAFDIKAGDEKILSTYRNAKDDVYKQIEKDGRISFASKGAGICLLANGWSTPELWGVWADSSNSFIALPDEVFKYKAIKFKFKALVSKLHPVQKISLSIQDSSKVNTYALLDPGLNEVVFTLPKYDLNKIGRDSRILKIESFNSAVPKALGMGQDNRSLSVGLISMEFL